MIQTPYLLFLGDAPDTLAAKVAIGIRDWRPEVVLGQWRLAGCQIDLGLPELTPEQAVAAGVKTVVVGVANRGGVIAPHWLGALQLALHSGLDLASGLHQLLTDQPDLVTAAKAAGRHLFDVRVPQIDYPIANGKRRSGRRCLAIGTDCSVGKMYTMLAVQSAMQERGQAATFRATGQTGILITGDGVPLDAVVADFMAGSIEWLTPDNDPEHWDLIEGQGSLFHASYSGVTLALIHGGQPDALILCHEPTRQHLRGLPDYRVPALADLQTIGLTMARMVNPSCVVVGLSINTAGLSADESQRYLRVLEAKFQLPAVDPYRQGAQRLAQALVEQ